MKQGVKSELTMGMQGIWRENIHDKDNEEVVLQEDVNVVEVNDEEKAL